MGGFIKIPRGLFDGTEFGIEKFSRREAFIDLVQMAAFKPTTTYISGNKITIDRGEIVASGRFLAARWGWSPSRVSRFISALCETGRCARRTGGITIITILDYDRYNGDTEPEVHKPEPAPKPQTEPAKRFVKPTVEQIRAFCSEHGYAVDAERFFNYYESKGWVVGKAPMKNWQAAVRQWVSRDKQSKPTTPAPTPAPQENQVDPELRRLFTGRYNKK